MRRLALLYALSLYTSGCEGCEKKKTAPVEKRSAPRAECASPSDCKDDDPCSEMDCRDARCVAFPVAAGTNCDNETVCDGVASCDERGRCVKGPPPDVDDGNACTRDSCDSKRGAVHEPVDADDLDACTKDECDPKTGQVSHEPVDIDDGDDCTLDSCDPRSGPKHDPKPTRYECGACGEGFHTASRATSRQCGRDSALQSFCVPNCGASFYSCDAACPQGWQEKSRAMNKQCGPDAAMLFCMRTGR